MAAEHEVRGREALTPSHIPEAAQPLPASAQPGDAVHVSEMFRLVRGTGRILDVLDVLHRDRLGRRIHDGAFSAMDLTARHPRTGELLSTVNAVSSWVWSEPTLLQSAACASIR
ncbi:hypothetical protein ACIRL2_26505 [Embleya sp. NPDC127516]|uniref:hypothetical protein n=1 Tax=Embleya sp. NPDC127516 TaxID=3363990 RepID=UPI00380925DE